MIINRAITIVCLVGGVLAILISLGYSNPVLPIIAAVFFMLSIFIWKYGYLFIPAITKATNLVEIRQGYEIVPSRDYIIKREKNGYYASKFLEIRFYESSMDKNPDEKKLMFEAFEKTISSLKYVVRISLMVSALDLSDHIDEIKTKRSALEAKKEREGKESKRMDRELAFWNGMLDRITQGERPVQIIAFASTTAFGLTREEAITRISRQAKELKTILSSSLGCEIRELLDLDMIKCFEWEKFEPTTREELKDQNF